MADLTTSPITPISSSKPKLVCLYEWWLIEVEGGSKLGIGGYSSTEMVGAGSALLSESRKTKNRDGKRSAIRVFHSAAIAKRHNDNTLETVDGITITISGSINSSQTRQNGFPIEVCNHFCFGFPCYWEEYASKSSPEKLADMAASFIDLPVTEVRDILMSTTGESEACALTSIIFRDILKLCGRESLDHDVPLVVSDEEVEEFSKEIEVEQKQDDGGSLSDATGKKTVVLPTPKSKRNSEISGSKLIKDVMNSFRRSQKKATREAQEIYSYSVDSDDEVFGSSIKTETERKQEDDGSLSHTAERITEKAQQIHLQNKVDVDARSLYKGVTNLTETYQKSPVKLNGLFSTPGVSEDSSQRMHAARIDFKKCNSGVISGEKRKAKGTQEGISVRRSWRLKLTSDRPKETIAKSCK